MSIVKRALLAGIIASVLFGGLLMTPSLTHAQSSSQSRATVASNAEFYANCGWPRCVVLLNRSETSAVANSGPGPLIAIVGRLGWMGVYLAPAAAFLAITYRWLISAYNSEGLCVGFNFSLVPWEPMGIFGYYC